jgi:hypothetical protein
MREEFSTKPDYGLPYERTCQIAPACRKSAQKPTHAPQQMASPFDHFVGEQATFHFGRLARRAVGLVSRDFLLAAYQRQH